MLFIFALAAIIVVALNVIIPPFTRRAPIRRTLYVREITSPPSLIEENKISDDDGASSDSSSKAINNNPFAAEFIVMFEYTAIIVDYAVMKYVGEDVRILTKQETKHALLHLAAIKQHKAKGEQATRWRWFVWLADFSFLRLGRAFGTSITLHIEASAWGWMYIPMALPFLKGSLSNLFVFHGMEEAEHGALTVQSLRKQTYPLVSLLTFPVVIVLHLMFLFLPPLVAIITRPSLLLLPRSYLDFVSYLLAFIPAFIGSTYGQIAYCLFPFRQNETFYNKMYDDYQAELKERKIAFNIVDQETYSIQ